MGHLLLLTLRYSWIVLRGLERMDNSNTKVLLLWLFVQTARVIRISIVVAFLSVLIKHDKLYWMQLLNCINSPIKLKINRSHNVRRVKWIRREKEGTCTFLWRECSVGGTFMKAWFSVFICLILWRFLFIVWGNFVRSLICCVFLLYLCMCEQISVFTID